MLNPIQLFSPPESPFSAFCFVFAYVLHFVYMHIYPELRLVFAPVLLLCFRFFLSGCIVLGHYRL